MDNHVRDIFCKALTPICDPSASMPISHVGTQHTCPCTRLSSIPLIAWWKLFLETVLRWLTGELVFHVFWDRILQKQLCVTCPSRLFQIHPNSWKKTTCATSLWLGPFSWTGPGKTLSNQTHFDAAFLIVDFAITWHSIGHGDLRSFELPISRATRTNFFFTILTFISTCPVDLLDVWTPASLIFNQLSGPSNNWTLAVSLDDCFRENESQKTVSR